MPTALIADDEEAPRAQLVAELQRVWPELRVVQECVNGIDAWDAFLEHEPQVCFLDVRMPGLTGIEVAQRIRARAHIVFIAAQGDHALAAFDAGAVDYVLRPIDAERLARACEHVKARLAATPHVAPVDLQSLLNRLVGQVRKPAPLEAVQASVRGKEAQPLRLEQVVYFESDGRYTRAVVEDGGEALIRVPLKELLAQLDPSRFWQVHRSVVVNRRHIAAGAVRGDDGTMMLTLHDRDEKLPVARHFQSLFEAA